MPKVDNRHKEIGGKHRALSRYYMIAHRISNTDTKKNKGYQGIKLLVEKDDFVEWFSALDFAGCSVDRIDKDGNYELSNMQVIPLSQNIAKDKLISKDGESTCYRCKNTKPLSDFVTETRNKSVGKATICKQCDSDRKKG